MRLGKVVDFPLDLDYVVRVLLLIPCFISIGGGVRLFILVLRLARALSRDNTKRLHIFVCMHIGNRIKEVLSQKGMSVPEFAEALPCARENVYKIFQKESLGTKLLMRISIVLEHDFFSDFSECI